MTVLFFPGISCTLCPLQGALFFPQQCWHIVHPMSSTRSPILPSAMLAYSAPCVLYKETKGALFFPQQCWHIVHPVSSTRSPILPSAMLAYSAPCVLYKETKVPQQCWHIMCPMSRVFEETPKEHTLVKDLVTLNIDKTRASLPPKYSTKNVLLKPKDFIRGKLHNYWCNHVSGLPIGTCDNRTSKAVQTGPP